jgi:predicted signal transduction protein with EAL and GGDEF domain
MSFIALLQDAYSIPPYEHTPIGPSWLGIVLPLLSLIASMVAVLYVYRKYAH